MEKFLTEVQQNRNVIIGLGNLNQTIDTYKQNKNILLNYISQLQLIKSKMNFGKEDHCIKIEFEWRDIFKGSKWKSYNINFEYFNCLYSLATIYYILGNLSSNEAGNDESKLKESINYYKQAAGLYDLIKNEISTGLSPKEIPIDLSPSYMTYCSYICIALGQKNLCIVAHNKKMKLDLQSQLLKGVAEMFLGASSLAKDSIKKYIDDNIKLFLNNRANYYLALSYARMRDKKLEEFNSTTKGFGEALVYQFQIVTVLQSNEKEKKKIQNLLNEKEELDVTKEQEKGEEMHEKNLNIYRNPVPNFEELPKIQRKLMVNPTIPSEFGSEVIENANDLDALLPKEVKAMINEYKTKMMDFISENLSNYENEDTIQNFLNSLNLPSSLETILSQSAISDSLWKNIGEFQEKGASMYLNNLLQTLSNMPNEIEQRINNSLNLLKNEEEEDKKLRQQYGSQWNRRLSSDLNGNYLRTLNDYKNKLNQARQCDIQTKNDISNNFQNFDLISLSREKLNEKIPHKIDSGAIKNCKEAIELRSLLDELEIKKEKAMEIINKIFSVLNDDNVAPQFLQVLQKKMTENAILDNNKGKYMDMFNELQGVTNEIHNLKQIIITKNEDFVKIKNDKFKPDPENEQFFKNLDQFVQLARQKEIQLQQGLNFYKQFNLKLNELNRNITDFILSRDIDKNQLIKYLTQGGSYQENQNTNEYELNTGYWDIPTKLIGLGNKVYQGISGVIGMNSNNNNNNNNTNNNNNSNYNNQQKPNNYVDYQQQQNTNQNYNIYAQSQNINNQPQNLYSQQQPYSQQQSQFGQQQGQYGQQQSQYGQQQSQYGQPQSQFGQQQGQYGQQQSQFGQQQGQFGQQQGQYGQQQGQFGQQQSQFGQQQSQFGQPQNQFGQPQNQFGQPQNQFGQQQGQFGQQQNQFGQPQNQFGQQQGYSNYYNQYQ